MTRPIRLDTLMRSNSWHASTLSHLSPNFITLQSHLKLTFIIMGPLIITQPRSLACSFTSPRALLANLPSPFVQPLFRLTLELIRARTFNVNNIKISENITFSKTNKSMDAGVSLFSDNTKKKNLQIHKLCL